MSDTAEPTLADLLDALIAQTESWATTVWNKDDKSAKFFENRVNELRQIIIDHYDRSADSVTLSRENLLTASYLLKQVYESRNLLKPPSLLTSDDAWSALGLSEYFTAVLTTTPAAPSGDE